MLIVPGPTKVDFLFPEVPNEKSPPWRVDKDSLNEVDAHFWDWMLWLASKQFRGNEEPMSVQEVPESISDAIKAYKRARRHWETKLQISIGRELQHEVEPVLVVPPSY